MKRHFHEELTQLKQDLIQMGLLVESAIEKAVSALIERDDSAVKSVFEDEETINRHELDIDDKGHSLFALGQPMAVDLRFITGVLNINTDLERIGDHAVNIAEKALFVLQEPPLEGKVPLAAMAKTTREMLRDALKAFIDGDVELARAVLERDDEVDDYNSDLYAQLIEIMEHDPTRVKVGVNLLMVGHNLERIADLANNIAEDVIYMKQGKEVRHHVEEGRAA